MYFNSETLCLLDGQFVKAADACGDLFSQTLHYGNGVFEGMRSYDTPQGAYIFKAKEHFDRFLFSAEKMNLPTTYSAEELVELSYQLLEKNQLSDAYLRPLLYAAPQMSLVSSQKTTLFMTAWKWQKLYGDKLTRLMTSSFRRPDPRSVFVEAKVCGHYVNSILATNEARQKGYDDGIMLDSDGFVAEASGANVFFEKNEVLYTPPRGQILPGITRATIIEICAELGIPVVEKKFTIEELKKADGVFLTGTAAEVTGVESIDNQPLVMRWEDTLGHMLARKYHHLVTMRDRDWTVI